MYHLTTYPLQINIEKGLEIMADDECLEVTPNTVRLWKQGLQVK